MLSLCAREKLKTFDNMVATSKYLTLFAVKFAQINNITVKLGYNELGYNKPPVITNLWL